MLYDLTNTYFEGDADALPQAQRGYSRDHRPDCKQLVLALIVTPEGFPVTCEVFPGHLLDRTTLEHLLDTIETKFGKPRRLWVFDRGLVSDDNLELLRQRGVHYLVGKPKSQLKAYEQKLLAGDWQKISEAVQVQLLPEADEVYVLCRSAGRVQKERVMRPGCLSRHENKPRFVPFRLSIKLTDLQSSYSAATETLIDQTSEKMDSSSTAHTD